jgi:hypothetical protein
MPLPVTCLIEGVSDPLHRYNVDGVRVSEDFDPLHGGGEGVADQKPPEPRQDAGCSGVADQNGGVERGEDSANAAPSPVEV